MTIKTLRQLWIGLWIAGGAAASAQTGTPLSATELAEQAQTAEARMCSTASTAPPSGNAAEDRAMKQMQAAQCACMKSSLQAWVQSAPQVTRWGALTALNHITDTCAARNVRELVTAFCNAGLDPLAKPSDRGVGEPQRRARCECMKNGLAPLTDTQLVESASIAYRDFRAKVQARMASAPDPDPTPSPVQTVQQTCLAAAPQR